MLSSQQPPTQINRHAQLLEIFIEVDQRGAVDVGDDVDVGVDANADDDTNVDEDCAGVCVACQLLSTVIFAKATVLALTPEIAICEIDSDDFLLLQLL